MIYPFVGGLVGYVGARLAGIEDGLAIFGIAIFTMITATVGGLFLSRRSGR